MLAGYSPLCCFGCEPSACERISPIMQGKGFAEHMQRSYLWVNAIVSLRSEQSYSYSSECVTCKMYF